MLDFIVCIVLVVSARFQRTAIVDRENWNPESGFAVQENDILQTNLFKERRIRNESRKQKKQTRSKSIKSSKCSKSNQICSFCCFCCFCSALPAFPAFSAFPAFPACASPTRDLIKGNRLSRGDTCPTLGRQSSTTRTSLLGRSSHGNTFWNEDKRGVLL